MFELETDAPFTAASDIATNALACVTHPTIGGRLGVIFALDGADARMVGDALEAAGFTVYVTKRGRS